MIDTRLALIKSRMQFYRDSYRRSVTQLIVMLAIILILLLAIFVMIMRPPQRRFFVSTTAGTLAELKVLDSPNYSSTPLIK